VGFWEQYGQGIIIILIILIVLIAGFIGYKFLRKKIQKKMDDQQVLV